MKQVLIRQGQIVVEDVPAPLVQPGSVLVRVSHSCISAGTEMSSINASSSRRLGWKLFAQPRMIKKAIDVVRERGISGLVRKLKETVDESTATGYSATGTIIQLGEGVTDLHLNERVACAGAGYANHAEIVCAPRNLVAPVPDGVDSESAATTTLGAIALQGIRRANPTLGETFVVLGLGIVGQLTVQLLGANGCRTIGVDLDRDRIQLATQLGMSSGVHPEDDQIDAVIRLTDRIGADGVIITAATPSHEVVSTAFQMCRRKGRVVLVGDVGLNLDRADFYEKELDFYVSTSYGPGRYDQQYEEEGVDYPIGYVRWTENRNLNEYLRLLQEGRINVKPLISATYPVGKAPDAYDALKDPNHKPLIVVLAYPEDTKQNPVRTKTWVVSDSKAHDKVRFAVIGAGSFAQGVHLPNLRALSDKCTISAIVSKTGHNALSVARRYRADYATTDYRDVLRDPNVDAVLISTRHHLHAQMVVESLQAGKHVLVEKPLALSKIELESIDRVVAANQNEKKKLLLMTGFNRRFSPVARKIKQALHDVRSPLIISYRMNAGYLPPTHWVHSAEGGGRNRGEACHLYDLFTYFTQSVARSVKVQSIFPLNGYVPSDNFVASIAFADGSVATLTYVAMGSPTYPKESMEIFADGMTIVMTDYQRLEIIGKSRKDVESKALDKGQEQELIEFLDAILRQDEWPIPWWQQAQATLLACTVEESLDPSSAIKERERAA